VVVLGIQAAALGALAYADRGPVVAAVLVCASRVALTVTCARGVPAARPDGLGASHAGSVPLPVVVAAWLAVGAVSTATLTWAGGCWWCIPIGFVVAAAAVGLLVVRATRRLGGVTGDIFGAAIEVMLAILLLSA
jgi:adenosylcobinamide-GDP ribazoletransferase